MSGPEGVGIGRAVHVYDASLPQRRIAREEQHVPSAHWPCSLMSMEDDRQRSRHERPEYQRDSRRA
jgi:hypothetical protein